MGEKKVVYRIGDPSQQAFLVKSGKIYVSTPYLEEYTFELPNLLVGAIELFLEEDKKIPPRIFHLAIDEDGEIASVTFDTVLELAQKYEFGFSANRFLAKIIDYTNTQLQMKRVKTPAEWRSFEERAAAYISIIDALINLWNETGISEYKRLAEKKQQATLYKDGEVFQTEKLFSRIDLGPKPLDDYLLKIPKDEIICKKNEEGDSLYVLLEGAVGVVSGGNYVATIREPGEAFGELIFFTGGKRTAGLVAIEDSVLYRISKDNLKLFHSTHPLFFIQIARTLASRIERNLRNLKLLYADDKSSERNATIARKNQIAGKELKEAVEELKGFKRLTSGPELNKVLEHILKIPAIAKLYEQ